MEILGDKTFGSQLELFDCDIDVLYNAGRFAMCGAYNNDNDVKKLYKVINWYKPVFLPKVVFNEIMKKLGTNKEVKKTIVVVKKESKKRCHPNDIYFRKIK